MQDTLISDKARKLSLAVVLKLEILYYVLYLRVQTEATMIVCEGEGTQRS